MIRNLGILRSLCQSKLMAENIYLKLAGEKLGYLADLAEQSIGEDSDMSVTDKILRLTAKDASIVINTQTPNRQLWYSSNLSGPQRFDYCAEEDSWKNQAGQII